MEHLCKTTVTPFYEEVIKEVIENIQEQFIEEGIDQDVIQELKRTWESKIQSNKSIIPAESQINIPPEDNNKTVPVQIVLPAQPLNNVQQKVLIINVPAYALQSNQLYNVLSGPLLTATTSLPQALAASLLQQHMDAAFMSRKRAIANPNERKADLNVKCSQYPMDLSKPSTSGLNQCKNSEKRDDSDDDDDDEDNEHKLKKKKMKSKE